MDWLLLAKAIGFGVLVGTVLGGAVALVLLWGGERQ